MRFVSLSVVVSFVLLGGGSSAHALPRAAASPVAAVAGPQASGTSAQQQQQVRVEENVVVTADRDDVGIRDVGSSVTVISSDEIAASGARWLIDVLQFAPGVTVTRNGPPGSITDVFLRGANSSHTLFLIDGVKANFPTAGSYDLGNLQLAADQIERIEIVRGPQSTLYGSQAIGGVINVITRRGEGPGTWGVEAEGGSYSTGRVHTWGNGEIGSLRYTGSMSYFDSDGFSTANRVNGNTEADGFTNLSYNARVDYATDAGLRLRGFARGFDGTVMFDGFDYLVGPVDGLNDTQDTREIYAGAAAGYAGERFGTEVVVSVSDVDSVSDTPDGFFTAFLLDSAIYEVDWQNDFVLFGAQQLTAGVEYRREQATISSESAFGAEGFDESVDFAGIYLQDRVTIGGRAHVAAGFRYEHHSTFGHKWTGRLTASVDANDAVRLHGSVGSGFKAPTLNDLYYPGFANPALRPEESIGFDLGFEAAAAGARADVTFFRTEITDLIQFDFVAGIPLNVGEVLAQGVEIDAGYALAPGVELSGNYTLTRSTPVDGEDQLVRRPRHQGGVRVSWAPAGPLRTWSELRFKGGRWDSGAAGRVQLDPYAIVNLAADYRISRALVLRGRIDNLFDSEFEEVLGYGTMGISGYAGLTFTLARQ